MQETRKYLGTRIQELRKQKGFKQVELAEKLNIDAKHISKIECGRCFPSFELLDKIAKVFEVEPYEILQNSHLKSRKEITTEIIEILKKLPDDRLKNIYTIIKNIT